MTDATSDSRNIDACPPTCSGLADKTANSLSDMDTLGFSGVLADHSVLSVATPPNATSETKVVFTGDSPYIWMKPALKFGRVELKLPLLVVVASEAPSLRQKLLSLPMSTGVWHTRRPVSSGGSLCDADDAEVLLIIPDTFSPSNLDLKAGPIDRQIGVIVSFLHTSHALVLYR